MFQRLKFYIKSLLGKKTQYHSFEESGNYVYSLSIREVEKMALGIGFRYIAVKGINDVYVEGVEDVSLSDNNLLFKSLKKKIARLDFLVKAGLQQSNILIAVIFKEEPSVALKNELNKSGFEVIGLPKNPYL